MSVSSAQNGTAREDAFRAFYTYLTAEHATPLGEFRLARIETSGLILATSFRTYNWFLAAIGAFNRQSGAERTLIIEKRTVFRRRTILYLLATTGYTRLEQALSTLSVPVVAYSREKRNICFQDYREPGERRRRKIRNGFAVVY